MGHAGLATRLIAMSASIANGDSEILADDICELSPTASDSRRTLLDNSLARDRRYSGVPFRGFDKLRQHSHPAVVQHVAQCLIAFAVALEASDVSEPKRVLMGASATNRR